MLSKAAVKRIHALRFKKQRQKYNLFVAEGDKLVTDLLQSASSHNDFAFKQVYAIPAWLDKNEGLLAKNKIPAEPIQLKELKEVSSLSTPNQVLAVLHIPEYALSLRHLADQLVIGLEFIQDPGNMGNILRIADWYGIRHILCSKNCVDIYNPKVVQATMGSIVRVKVHYVDLKAKLSRITAPVYGTVLEGENIHKAELSGHGVIVLGNEAKGISKELLPVLDKQLTIPRFGALDSLNVAAATAVVCDNFRRQEAST